MTAVWNDQIGEYVEVETPLHLRVRRPYLVTVIDVMQGTTREIPVVEMSKAHAILAVAPDLGPSEQTLGELFVREGRRP